ncbi:MAG: hypothetical protein PHE02_06590 [Lachnospiraceae bacterium]|nr:hypothetical protein [Lachnospiraceae bacterium]
MKIKVEVMRALLDKRTEIRYDNKCMFDYMNIEGEIGWIYWIP